MVKCDPLGTYPLRWNQSSIEFRSSSRGTLDPISISPSPTGSVSSKTVKFVKLRIENESSHFSGQGSRVPFSSYSTRTLRTNMPRLNQMYGIKIDSIARLRKLCGDEIDRCHRKERSKATALTSFERSTARSQPLLLFRRSRS